jgi:hypothetical protein
VAEPWSKHAEEEQQWTGIGSSVILPIGKPTVRPEQANLGNPQANRLLANLEAALDLAVPHPAAVSCWMASELSMHQAAFPIEPWPVICW